MASYCYATGKIPNDNAFNSAQINTLNRGVDPKITGALDRLNAALAEIDVLFNASTNVAGGSPPSASAIAAVGLFKATSHVILHGPSVPIGVFPYVIGSGSNGAIGVVESSTLEATVETVLKETYGSGATSFHEPITLIYVFDACDGKHACVNSKILIRDAQNNLVAVVRGLADIALTPTGVPPIDWYHATIQAIAVLN